MPDAILTAHAPEAGFSVAAATTTALVSQAQARHSLSPTATAALGRLMTAAAILGAALKGDERISLQIAGDGPLRGVVAEAWLITPEHVGVRGYTKVADVDLPLNATGKFDVARAVGSGSLQVTRSFPSGSPYAGIVPLLSGEIAEDVASYLVNSEQIPSAVALGVLADPQGVRAAGGAIVGVLPGATETMIADLERRALRMPPVTQMLNDGADTHALLHAFAGGAVLRAHRVLDVSYACRCTRDKVEIALAGLGADDLLKMSSEKPEIEATCEFCRKTYAFAPDEIAEIVSRLKKA